MSPLGLATGPRGLAQSAAGQLGHFAQALKSVGSALSHTPAIRGGVLKGFFFLSVSAVWEPPEKTPGPSQLRLQSGNRLEYSCSFNIFPLGPGLMGTDSQNVRPGRLRGPPGQSTDFLREVIKPQERKRHSRFHFMIATELVPGPHLTNL